MGKFLFYDTLLKGYDALYLGVSYTLDNSKFKRQNSKVVEFIGVVDGFEVLLYVGVFCCFANNIYS